MKKLNVGCGNDIRKGWVNLDIAKLAGVDIVHDIQKIPWPIKNNTFDEIECSDILEHVDYIPILKEMHRIIKKGGILRIKVPHFTSRNNFIDPTHKKMFSIKTFEFFVKDSQFNRDYYFDFSYSKLNKRRITFEKHISVCYNYLVQPLINIHPNLIIYYEATFLRNLFPAENIIIELQK